MEIMIEKASSEDLAFINEIYNHYVLNTNATFDVEAWTEQHRITWFESFNRPESAYHLFVAKEKGQVIGFAYNGKFKEKQAYFTSSEVTIYIKQGFGGHGIGNQLYQVLFAALKDTRLHCLYAAITLPNPASISLHEKYGFKLVGTMEEVGFKNNQFVSVSLFEKKLDTEN